MRKGSLLAVLLAVCLAVLCACGSAPVPSGNAEEEQKPVLNIGTTSFAPYFYMNEDGQYVGVDYEIALEACSRIGFTPNFVVMDWDSRDEQLDSGSIDCIWNCFIMNGREDDYQWAGPYLNSDIAVLVSADSSIRSVSALAGKTVASRINSRVEDFFLNNENAPHIHSLSTFANMHSAFTAFGKGYADAVVEHHAALEQLTASNPSLYRFLDEPLFTVQAGVAFSKTADPSVVEALNEALAEMSADGSIASIAQKYGLPENDYTLSQEGDSSHES